VNGHFDIAEFLLERGADINTTWSSHEPAGILHELAGLHENSGATQRRPSETLMRRAGRGRPRAGELNAAATSR